MSCMKKIQPIVVFKEPFAMELIGFIQKRIPLYLQSPQKEIHKAHLHKVKHILNAVRILHEVSS